MGNRITNRLLLAGAAIVAIPVIGIGMVVSPIISLVALPVLWKMAKDSKEAQARYDQALQKTDRPGRHEFGRTEDEDYTCWDGRKREIEECKRIYGEGINSHEQFGLYISRMDRGESKYQFKAQDLQWLQQEQHKVVCKNDMIYRANLTKVIAKLCIPIIGFIWALILWNEMQPYTNYMSYEYDQFHEWTVSEAIDHHIKVVTKLKLAQQQASH